MKKEFIEKVLEQEEVVTKKFKYMADTDQEGTVKIIKYSLDGDFLEVVWADEKETPESSDVRTEEESGNEPLPFEEQLETVEVNYEDFSLLSEEELTARTYQAIDSMGRNYLEIAALLYTAKRRIDHGEMVCIGKILTGASCTDIYDYGKRNFGFARGTVSDYINIADRYLKRWEATDKNFFIPMAKIKDEYAGYSVSQLQALLPIKDNVWVEEHCNPSMTVRELKSLAKQWKNETFLLEDSSAGTDMDTDIDTDIDDIPENTSESSDVRTEENVVPKVVKDYIFSSFDEYNNSLDKMDTKISNLLKSGKRLVVSIAVTV